MLIKFPIIRKNKNPIEEFYTNSLLSSQELPEIQDIVVTAFTINPKDYRKLLKLLDKYIKNIFINIPVSKRKHEGAFILMDMGPRISSKIPEGFVKIDKRKLLNGNIKK